MATVSENVIIKDPNILGGEPVFRGTRVPFKVLTDYLEGGDTLDQFLEEYPSVSRELVRLAEAAFDVFVTVDTNLRYQQNLAGRRIAVVVLQSSSNRLEHLRQHFPACVLALEKIKPGEMVQIGSTS